MINSLGKNNIFNNKTVSCPDKTISTKNTHPRVYIKILTEKNTFCPYCSKLLI